MLSPLRFVILGLAATALSCSGRAGPAAPCGAACPNTRLAARLLSGTVSFSIAGGPVQTLTVGPGDPPLDHEPSSPTRCTAGAPVERATPGNEIQPAFDSGGTAGVECQVPGGFFFINADVGPRRVLDSGPHAIPVPTPTLLLGSTICGSGPPTGTATVTVTKAVGTQDTYPALVSTDYLREFGLHIEASVPMTTTPCTMQAISVTEDLSLVESAADVVQDPTAFCQCID